MQVLLFCSIPLHRAMLMFKSVQHGKNDFENPTRDPGPGPLQDTSHKSGFFFKSHDASRWRENSARTPFVFVLSSSPPFFLVATHIIKSKMHA